MRSRILVPTILLACIASMTLTGCSWFRKKPATPGVTGGPESPVAPMGTTDIGARPLATGEMNRSPLAAQTVYFDYDSATIRSAETSKLDAIAAYMKSNTGVKLVIEGHCDERGTAEYNRALGERRALAARDALAKMGVDASRMSTISYGKERPVEPSHDDTAWSRNRRCEFVVAGQ